MEEVRRKKWNMRPETRIIVSKAYKLCKEMNETYGQRVSVRQIYYYLISRGIVEPTNGYRKTGRVITEARKRGYIPFEWVEDRSRSPIWEMVYQNLEHFLKITSNKYRKNTWINQENFMIILVEKEALAPIIWDIAKQYNVSVFPTKGFSSWSMFVEDIKQLADYFGKRKNLIVLILSDLDPSGKHIKNDYINKFEFMSKELGFRKPHVIEKIALTKNQVKKNNLPAIKKKYKNKGILDIWELDALNPKDLRSIVKEAIEKYMDLEQLHKDLEAEAKEKEDLKFLVDTEIVAYLSSNGAGGLSQ